MVEPQLTHLMDHQPPEVVLTEVERTIRMASATVDLKNVRVAHDDTCRLFRGEYPGYRSCTNAYHDLDHTMHVFLAMAQLIHGYILSGRTLSDRGIVLGMIAPLFHDIGFIQAKGDTEGTGAKYTTVHEQRGIDFASGYLREHGFSEDDVVIMQSMIRCTCLRETFDEIDFPIEEAQTLGQILGSADLLGQMGDRLYLEKLPFLYREFQEADIGGYENELDLLDKTLGFWEFTQQRLDETLGGVHRLVQNHFQARYGVDRDLYFETIEEQIAYLQHVLDNHRDDYRDHLRRDKLIERLQEMEDLDAG